MILLRLGLLLSLCVGLAPLAAQEKSVKPGINDPFKNPDLQGVPGQVRGREPRGLRQAQGDRRGAASSSRGWPSPTSAPGPGCSPACSPRRSATRGKVYAVDIATKFLDHIAKTGQGAEASPTSRRSCAPRPRPSCSRTRWTWSSSATPTTTSSSRQRTMASIHRALKPGGRLVVIDFHRIPGKSREWVLNHVRAGQEVVEKEIAEAGFKKTGRGEGSPGGELLRPLREGGGGPK